MSSEHERYLTEQVFKQPVIVYDHPKEFKSFYMRLNDDGKTVASMDVLVPGVKNFFFGNFNILKDRRVNWRISKRRKA